ncbi:uncharacterized protein LOC141849113 [Brevipalpus obovatus]|uniref:uncharacterized protein LOC141849113 n=1 Tax=Brevipalpus obovatus TaxID=246614 RepID=UPI003D9DCABC
MAKKAKKSKSPSKTASKTPSKTASKTVSKTASKSASKAPSKAPSKTSSKSAGESGSSSESMGEDTKSMKSKGSMKSTKASMKGSMKKKGSKEAAKHKKKAKRSFKTYLFKMIKKTDGGVGASKAAMVCLNGLCEYFLQEIAREAGDLVYKEGKKTLQAGDVQSSVMLVLPPGLAIDAVGAGQKAMGSMKGNAKDFELEVKSPWVLDFDRGSPRRKTIYPLKGGKGGGGGKKGDDKKGDDKK